MKLSLPHPISVSSGEDINISINVDNKAISSDKLAAIAILDRF